MAPTTSGESVSTASLYAAAIAIVSGGYSVLASSGGLGTSTGAWLMLLVGLVALVHGVALLTPAAGRLGDWSGPLMIAYALVMLLNRAVFPMGTGAMGPAGGMGPTGGMGPGGTGFGMMDGYLGTTGAAGGAGMVALAVLMLASGLIMTVRSGDGM